MGAALCPPPPRLSNKIKSFNKKDTKSSKHTAGEEANPAWERPPPSGADRRLHRTGSEPADKRVRLSPTHQNTAETQSTPGSTHQQGNHDDKMRTPEMGAEGGEGCLGPDRTQGTGTDPGRGGHKSAPGRGAGQVSPAPSQEISATPCDDGCAVNPLGRHFTTHTANRCAVHPNRTQRRV